MWDLGDLLKNLKNFPSMKEKSNLILIFGRIYFNPDFIKSLICEYENLNPIFLIQNSFNPIFEIQL